MAHKQESCIFCERKDGLVFTTRHLFFQLDDAPIIEGHALLVPRLHYPSVADLDPGVLTELDVLTDFTELMYRKTYGGFAFFEHGRTGHCMIRGRQDQICEHAHVHVLPLIDDIVRHIPLSQRIEFRSWHSVPRLGSDVDSYLLVGSSDGGRFFYPVAAPLPPHYLRTMVASVAGDPGLADWEALLGTARSRMLIQAGAERIREQLSTGRFRLPSAISQNHRAPVPGP
jgi:diadenosine tetraphosphate (Ap4A) HIT family hydrolase